MHWLKHNYRISGNHKVPVILRRMQAKLAEALYYRYDTARPWAEQFEANLAWLAGQRARLEEMQQLIHQKNR